MSALRQLRYIEKKHGKRIDDESVPFLALLRDKGVLSDEDWQVVRAAIPEALALLRKRWKAERGTIYVDWDPRNADWIKLVAIYKIAGYRLPGWATQWLRRIHPRSDRRFWRKVAPVAAEFGLRPVRRRKADA